MSANVPRQSFTVEMPTGTEVAAFKRYADATKAVDKLSEAGFPLNSVTVVGSDLHMVERVVGKLTPARVALGGAGQGLTWGLLMGLFAILLLPDSGMLLVVIAIAVGVLGGVLLAAITWGLSRNRRSYASRNSLVAAHYTILVSQDPQKAFGVLANAEGNVSSAVVRRPARLEEAERTRARRERISSKPPQFGVRLSDAPQEKWGSDQRASGGDAPSDTNTPRDSETEVPLAAPDKEDSSEER